MIKQRKKNLNWKERKKTVNVYKKNILYRETDIDAIKNLLEIIYESIKLHDKKIISRNLCSIVFLYTKSELLERESNKNST